MIWGVKVRVAAGGNKYPQVKGSRPALYGAGRMGFRPVVVVCEGEFDALLTWQEAGGGSRAPVVDVVTPGGARMGLAEWWLPFLMVAELVLVAFDVDAAGAAGAAAWRAMLARARRVRVAEGRDVTEFWQAGGEVRAWVEYEVARGQVDK